MNEANTTVIFKILIKLWYIGNACKYLILNLVQLPLQYSFEQHIDS